MTPAPPCGSPPRATRAPTRASRRTSTSGAASPTTAGSPEDSTTPARPRHRYPSAAARCCRWSASAGLFDQAHELLVQLGAPDVRPWATEFVAGDIGKAMSQASAWEHAAQALAAISGQPVPRLPPGGWSWEGSAASSSRTHSRAWIGALDLQGDTMARVAAHLRDAVEQAVDVAQLVVDTVKEMLAIVLAGWSSRLHPDLRPGRARQAAPRRGEAAVGRQEGGRRLLVLPAGASRTASSARLTRSLASRFLPRRRCRRRAA